MKDMKRIMAIIGVIAICSGLGCSTHRVHTTSTRSVPATPENVDPSIGYDGKAMTPPVEEPHVIIAPDSVLRGQ